MNNVPINVFGLDENNHKYPLKLGKTDLVCRRDLLLFDDEKQR